MLNKEELEQIKTVFFQAMYEHKVMIEDQEEEEVNLYDQWASTVEAEETCREIEGILRWK